jgi:hypothetical protein
MLTFTSGRQHDALADFQVYPSDKPWPWPYPDDVHNRWVKQDQRIQGYLDEGHDLRDRPPAWWKKLLTERFRDHPDVFEVIWKCKL